MVSRYSLLILLATSVLSLEACAKKVPHADVITLGPSQIVCDGDAVYAVVQYEKWTSREDRFSSPNRVRSWVGHSLFILEPKVEWTVESSKGNSDASLTPHMASIVVKESEVFSFEDDRVYQWSKNGFERLDGDRASKLLRESPSRNDDEKQSDNKRVVKNYSSTGFPVKMNCGSSKVEFSVVYRDSIPIVVVQSLDDAFMGQIEIVDKTWFPKGK